MNTSKARILGIAGLTPLVVTAIPNLSSDLESTKSTKTTSGFLSAQGMYSFKTLHKVIKGSKKHCQRVMDGKEELTSKEKEAILNFRKSELNKDNAIDLAM
jgi:hypothetical protein